MAVHLRLERYITILNRLLGPTGQLWTIPFASELATLTIGTCWLSLVTLFLPPATSVTTAFGAIAEITLPLVLVVGFAPLLDDLHSVLIDIVLAR